MYKYKIICNGLFLKLMYLCIEKRAIQNLIFCEMIIRRIGKSILSSITVYKYTMYIKSFKLSLPNTQ